MGVFAVTSDQFKGVGVIEGGLGAGGWKEGG